jgi:hypothetical protein
MKFQWKRFHGFLSEETVEGEEGREMAETGSWKSPSKN